MPLEKADLHALVDIAVKRQVNRDLLVAALRPSVQAGLKRLDKPGEQLLSDFQWLDQHADFDEGIDRLHRVLEQLEYLLDAFPDDQAAVRAIRLGLPAPMGHPSAGAAPIPAGHAWIWLALGVGVLGGALGFVSGLSTQRGVTGDLLFALATLAAGAAISLALVRWRRGSAPLPVAPLGVGVLLFVGLMVIGLIIGIKARDEQWFVSKKLRDSDAGTAGKGVIKHGDETGDGQQDCAAQLGVMRSGCKQDDPRGRAPGWALKVDRDFKTVDNECSELLRTWAPSLLVCAEARARMGGEDRLRAADALISAAEVLDPSADQLDRIKTFVQQKNEAP